MYEYLIDACVLSGFLNTEDVHHDACLVFFESHAGERFCFSIHTLFEFKASQSRRLCEGTFSPLSPLSLPKQRLFSLDKDFYEACQNKDLFRLFDKLKGADLIYACLAKLHSLTLVTCDEDFEQYSNIISILQL
jgi:predicted nucleic acid-binding protein